MDGNLPALAYTAEKIFEKTKAPESAQGVVEFYEHASMDYAHWSRSLNMHLGFYRAGMNPFDRETMLEQMNIELAERLGIVRDSKALLIDLGCGMGGVARSVARHYPHSIIRGVTVSPTQVAMASARNAESGLGKRIEILAEDFTGLPFKSGEADGAWAIESACYAQGEDKDDLVREMARILKPGGRFVIADCFVRDPSREFNVLTKRAYEAACKYWEVPEMPVLELFVTALERHGFRDIFVEDISWRAAPSVAHAPFAVLSFLLKKLLAREPLKRHSINNLKASLLALVIGSSRSKFSYCMISGRR